MQRKGVTNPRPEIKQFCEDFVRALEPLDPFVSVTCIGRGARGKDFVAGGKVLATLPAHEDPKWWCDDGVA
jgi:hypothetical protein